MSATPLQSKNYSDDYMMKKICKRASSSILCDNKPLYNTLKAIAENYNVPVGILLGIMAHESQFGTSYHRSNKEDCRENTNNWGGMKGNHTTNGVKKTTTIGHGCWIQKYDTVEEGFVSLARTIGIGYSKCLKKSNPVVCIAFRYVGNPSVAEKSWVNDVSSFY